MLMVSTLVVDSPVRLLTDRRLICIQIICCSVINVFGECYLFTTVVASHHCIEVFTLEVVGNLGISLFGIYGHMRFPTM